MRNLRGSCNILTNQNKTKTACVQSIGRDCSLFKAAHCLIGGERTVPAVLQWGLHLPYTILHCDLNNTMRWLGYHSFLPLYEVCFNIFFPLS